MFRTASTRLAFLFAPVVLLSACGNEAGTEGAPSNVAATASPPIDVEARLAAATDRSWINLSGTVVSTTPNSFLLDYGNGNVTVEMDDWDWYREGQALLPGDPVVVTGKVDNDLWQAKRIEASSVYAKNLNTYFFASGADEEDLATSTVYVPAGPTSSDSTGYVSAVEGQEFTIGSGTAAIRVDASSLASDKKPTVKVGDRVYAWGDLDLDPQEQTEIMAKGIVLLAKDRTKMSGGNKSRTATGKTAGDNAAGKAGANNLAPANSTTTQP